MNARLLLSDLRGAAGVNLTPQGDGLHVDAPAGALTGALRGCLMENKEGLIELLERERVGPEAADGVSSSAGRSTRPGSSCTIP